MSTILLVVHIMVATAMIVIILLQRSEGGALGMGGGGGGGLVSSRGAANLLTRLTSILAAVFFITSITLGIIGNKPKTAPAVGTTIQQPREPGAVQDAPSSLPDIKLRRQSTPAATTTPETPDSSAPTVSPAPALRPAEVPQSQ